MGRTARRGPRKTKYSTTVDMVKTRADLPVNPHHGQLCWVEDESRLFVYNVDKWLILTKTAELRAYARIKKELDDRLISKAEALRMDKEAVSSLRRELEATLPNEPPPEPPPEPLNLHGHTDYWIGRQYTCKYCGRPRKHRVGWIFQGNNPQGDTIFFCNVDCCNNWEATLDNMNDRRGAIAATKRKRAERGKND